MNLRRIILSIAALLTLAACGGAPVQTGPTKALPPEFVDAVLDAAFAETIADECGSIRYNKSREDKVLETYAVRLVAAGYTERDLLAGANKMERDPNLQVKALRMIQNRKIDVTKEASWCAAGRREMSRGTNIGRYLL